LAGLVLASLAELEEEEEEEEEEGSFTWASSSLCGKKIA
jgi:hypothetical protein